MYYELYVDRIFLIHFVMNLYLLLLVNRSLMCSATRLRLILGAAANAGMYLVVLLCRMPLRCKMPLGFVLGTVLMIGIAFRVRSWEAFWKIGVKCLMFSWFLGGALLFLLRIWAQLPGISVGFAAIFGLGALLVMGVGYLQERSEQKKYLCKVTLIHKQNRLVVTALVDSGNSLIEPISGKPVSVIEKKIFENLWGTEDALYRAIPYHSIGKKHGILQGYLLEELQIEANGVRKNCKEIYVAVSEEDICDSCQQEDGIRMIVNPGLL